MTSQAWLPLFTISSQMADNTLKLNIEVPFPTGKEAEIAYDVLRVDAEPPRSQVSKSVTFEKNTLSVYFDAPTHHQLRTGVNGFLDNLILVCETLNSFGPPINSQYLHS